MTDTGLHIERLGMHRAMRLAAIAVISVIFGGCANEAPPIDHPAPDRQAAQPAPPSDRARSTPHQQPAGDAGEDRAEARMPRSDEGRAYRVVHVIVCLADNQHQGIVRIPDDLGDGQNPRTNLYWGAMYGTKTYLQRSDRWRLVRTAATNEGVVLERCVFVHRTADPALYLVAEAYDGRAMKDALLGFFGFAAGGHPRRVSFADSGEPITCGSAADLICFIGHNGLMEVNLDDHLPKRARGPQPEQAVVLACRSKPHFAGKLAGLGCEPLVVTTGLMAPEAYTLDALVDAWAGGADAAATRRAAADAYAKYQRCSVTAARRLFDVR